VWPADAWSEQHAKAGRTFSSDAEAWSREEHIRSLLGDSFDLELTSGDWRLEEESGEALWEFVSNSMPPLRAWLASVDEATRAHAERVYLDFLSSGVFERHYVFVLGTRR
jgi:hypothetical protein